MAGMRIEFAQFGDFDSFSVYRSDRPMNIDNMPIPIAAGLTSMYYIDTEVDDYQVHYYRVACIRGSNILFSDEVTNDLNAEVPSSDIPTDYILRYDLNGDTLDQSTTFADGVSRGAVVFENGRKAGTQALRFNGGNVRTSKDIPITSSSLTISFWMLSRGTGSSGYIFLLNPSGAHGFRMSDGTYGKGTFYFQSSKSGGSINSFVRNFTADDVWHHVLLEVDAVRLGTDGINIYYDNILTVGSRVNTNPIQEVFGSSVWYIGDRDGSLPFKGSLQDIRVYNRILTESERTQLFNE